jgi:hypothetical protein
MARRKDPDAEAPADPVETPVEAPAEAPPVVEEAAPPPPAPAPARRSGILGPLLGGALAALGGFGLSHFNLLGLSAPDSSEALAALDARLTEGLAQGLAKAADPAALAALEGQVATLSDRLAALETAPPPDLSALADLDQRLAAIEAVPPGSDASTAALAAKLAELERRLATQPQGTDQAEVEAALARLDAAEAEAAARAKEAEAATAAAARALALDRLRAAVSAGTPFQDELAALADPALTETLAPHAAGVATLSTLQADFPEAAREALALARTATGDEGWGTRLLDFLADQTGARPLTPRDGATPEAILSRADFALGEARLADALTELDTLDPALRAPLAGWIARAEARRAVDAALEGL